MTDRLTQLQDAIDQMATQCFSALRYISDHHDALAVGNESKAADVNLGRPVDDPAVFQAAKSELARDLVVKAKQIEILITSLPGIGVAEDEQQARLRLLQNQITEAEKERHQTMHELEASSERLQGLLKVLQRV